MRLTDLRKRRKSLFALRFDLPADELEVGSAIKRERRFDEYGFLLLDMQTCLDAGLSEGMQLDSDTLAELIEQSDYNRAKSYALYKLGFRSYSTGELLQKLAPEYGRLAAEQAICRLVELNLLNDEAYAANLADKYINTKKCAPRDAVYKMVAKGIDRSIAQAAVDAIEPDIDAQLCELIEQKYLRQLADEKGLRRTIAALARRGYSYSDIRAALAKFRDNDDFDDYDE